MVKVPEGQFTVAKTHEGSRYVRGQAPDLSPIAQGLNRLGAALTAVGEEQKRKDEQMKRFKATSALVDYNTQVELEQNELRKNAAPDDTQFAAKAVDTYINREADFIKTLPPDLQEEFKMRVAQTRASVTIGAHEFQDKQLESFYTDEVTKRANAASSKIAEDPDALDTWRSDVHKMIDESDMSETRRYELKQKMDEYLEKHAYRATVRKRRLEDATYADDLSTSVRQAAQELGVDPVDLMTVISYETGGKLSTGVRGGAGNRHIGLIQFGPEEQKKYGAYEGQPVGEQMAAVVRYLKDRGFKPGMGLLDLYSTINAGSPGRYGASDAANGGMPGTVADKVRTQMGEHRAKALQIMDGRYVIPDEIDNDPRFQNVAYEDRIALRQDSNAEVNAMLGQLKEERKAATAAFNNNLYLQLQAGGGRELIEEAIAAGQLQDYDDRKKALDIIEKREKDAEEKGTFLNRLGAGMLLDPTDSDNKKGMNLLFGQKGLEALNNMDRDYVNNTLVPLFDQTGMMPPDAVSMLGALSRSNDPRQMLFANESLSILEERNPYAYAAQVPEDIRNRADQWEALRMMPEKQLIDLMQGAGNPEQRRVQRELRDDIKKAFASANPPVQFETVLEEFDAERPAGWKGQAMEMEWQQLFVENYARMGGADIDAVNAVTLKQLKRIWGTSAVGGTTVLMRNPPEHFYPPVGGSHQWIEDQLRGELGIPEDREIQLISDLRTEADIRRMQTFEPGKPNEKPTGPSYLVMEKVDGVWQPVMMNGQLVRQYFQLTPEDHRLANMEAMERQAANKYSYYLDLMKGMNGVVPPEILEEANQAKEDWDAKKALKDGQQTRTKLQYETNTKKRLKDLESRFKPLNDEAMNFTGAIEEWPRLEEWGQMNDEIERLREAVRKEAEELSKKRSAE